MKFQVGERLALVGQNGSGKTTFIKLLCRLYDPTEGEILLNGIDIRKYDYREYMSVFSVVFQDFQLLACSVGQNVAACAAYDREKVECCCKKAGFCDEIIVFHEGSMVQQGSHEALLAQEGGKYSELWNAQAQYYVSDAS